MSQDERLERLTKLVQQQAKAMHNLQLGLTIVSGRLDLLTSFILNSPDNYEAFYYYVQNLASAELPPEEELQQGAKRLQKVAQDYKKVLKSPTQKDSPHPHDASDPSFESIVIPFPTLDSDK
ncbi:MAG: hypothetical protein EP297_07285 [Gammaproteobacteria bacterium]|nr:MAG: hypothetical protein EP297_07285 [Gammaproteobacteria bacterium]